MRSLLPSALLAALALTVLPSLPQAAHADAGVLRCRMPDGSNVYTSKACGAFGATSAPLPGDLLARIGKETRREAAFSGSDVGNPSLMSPSSLVGKVATHGCADSPQQLAVNLQAAVAAGDVNRVAETYDWNGMRNAQAQRVMHRLAQLSSRTMVSVTYFDAHIEGLGETFADAGPAAEMDGGAGMLQARLDIGDGPQVMDFSVQRKQGCYLVRY